MQRKLFAIAALLICGLTGCKDQAPDREPEAVGYIAQVNHGKDRVNYLILDKLQTPTVDTLRLNVTDDTKVVWYATGRDVISHHQNITTGMYVRAWTKGGLMESNPPQMNATRVEVAYVRP